MSTRTNGPGIAAVALGLVGLLSVPLGQTRGASEKGGREFSFSASPQQAIVRIVHFGGLGALRSELNLYGDGRLEMRILYHDGQVKEHLERQMAYEEVVDLLTIVVESGLLDLDQEGLSRSLRSEGGRMPYLGTDMGTGLFEVNLSSYRSSTVPDAAPITRRYDIQSAAMIFEKFPNCREIGGAAAFEGALEGFRREARAEAKK